MAQIKPIKLLIIIADRNKDKAIINYLNGSGLQFHFAIPGRGTAPTDALSVTGLGDKDKTVFFCPVYTEDCLGVVESLNDIPGFGKGAAIAFTVPFNSIIGSDTVDHIMSGFCRLCADK